MKPHQLARFPLAVFALVATFALVPAGKAAVDDHAGHQHLNERLSTLQEPQPTLAGPKVEVIEFFWYGCPHCYQLEPAISKWLATPRKDVVFKRIPAVPSDRWAQMATMYYTLEALGSIDRLHLKVFEALHKEGLRLEQKTVREDWLAKHGMDLKKYLEVERSFTVITNVQRARQLTRAYKVDGVPRFVIGGRYATAPGHAGGNDAVFTVVDEAIARVRGN
jgi:thiol:disulfide interchange protein DsbA